MKDILLNARSVEVQKAAIYSYFNAKGNETDVKVLAELLDKVSDPELRKTIVYQLGNIKNKEVVPILVKVINEDKNLDVRKAAVTALGNMNIPEAQVALMKILQK